MSDSQQPNWEREVLEKLSFQSLKEQIQLLKLLQGK